MTRRTALSVAAAFALAVAAEAKDESPRRVHDPATGRDLRYRDLPGRLADADAVFLGEQHDDPETHRVEADLFRALHGRWGDKTTLAMEMFERDEQPALDDYLAGKTDEATFAKAVTLWKNYPTDYRPMIEFAKANRVPVLGSNAPERLVRAVGKSGLTPFADADKPLVGSPILTPDDAYWTRFKEIIGAGHDGMTDAMARRFYEAQCLRDETMGETVARAVAEGRRVVHVNGAFHSDAGLGTVARTLWRRPLATRVRVVKIIPVKGDLSRAETGTYRGEADFLVFVPDTRPGEKS